MAFHFLRSAITRMVDFLMPVIIVLTAEGFRNDSFNMATTLMRLFIRSQSILASGSHPAQIHHEIRHSVIN